MGNVKLQPTALLVEAYQAENFRTHGRAVVERLSAYLEQVQKADMPVLHSFDPEGLRSHFKATLLDHRHQLDELLDTLIPHAHHLHHPRFFCAQVVPVLPLVAWSEALVALLNNSSAVFEMSPLGAALENLLIDWFASKIGYPAGSAGGVLTNGGSAGNLTGLLAARQAKAGYDYWEEGARRDGPRFTVLVSEQAHYCVQRACQIMGWGAQGATLVAVGPNYSMTAQTLERAQQRALDQGLTPLAVSASACTTSSGAYDPLDVCADFCEQHGLWLHVDGAHGAPVLLSDRYKELVRGIQRADSVAWDLHKMMAMPLTATAVLFKRRDDSYQAFQQKASYLFGEGEERPWYQGGLRTLECSKRNLALSFWMALQMYGEAFFRDFVDYTHDLARAFADLVEASSDFELPTPAQSNIVCFRYRPAPLNEELDALQLRLRGLVNQSGEASIGSTRLRDGIYLRAVFMNPMTRWEDAVSLLSLIRQQALHTRGSQIAQ